MKLPLVFISCLVAAASAFVAPQATRRSTSALNLLAVDAPPAVTIQATTTSPLLQVSSTNNAGLLQAGIDSYAASSSSQQQTLSESSSTMTVALKERKIPTKEEIEAKKRNFNIIFWGGGFVAPFLATIFYFGPKFWTK